MASGPITSQQIDGETMETVTDFIFFPGSSVSKESAHNAGDPGSIPGTGRSPGEGNDNPLQYSGLENSMVRGAWEATVRGVSKSQARLKRLRTRVPESGLKRKGLKRLGMTVTGLQNHCRWSLQP